MSYKRRSKYHYKEEKRTHIVFSTEPLSLSGPTSVDRTNEKVLAGVLKAAGRLKEHKFQAQQRELVLQSLNDICQEWVKESARKHNLPEEFAINSKVRLFAFGSYKLDVHSVGDDVDLLCVGPHFLTRDMFFDELGEMMQTNSCVEHFYAVRNAYVPVMSFKYNGIDIDMVYAQLQIELLDKNWDINDDYNLRNLDQTSILSLNGVRLAHRTLALVPDRDVFRLSLRAIRYWAKQRGIYSNKLGYLGGVSWAILTARVCQLYPNANASQIVQNFFLFYHIWNFGTPLKAITLCNIVQHEDMPSIKVWDPNDQTTKYELMHIITPAFPAMNSTHNVSMATFDVLKREIARGFHCLSRANRGIDAEKWGTLFAKNTFFIDHKNYIFIKACAPKRNLTEWSGLIESKIRSLVNSLEHYADVKVTPYCKSLKLKLKQKEIDEHTHPDQLKRMELLKKKRIQQLKAKKKAELQRKKEEAKLRALQLKLQKEREEERARKEAEEKEKARREQEELEKQQQQKQSMDVEDGTNDKDTTTEKGEKGENDNDEDVDEEEEEKKDCVLPKLEPEDPIMTNTKKETDTKKSPSPPTKQMKNNTVSQISINDGTGNDTQAPLKHSRSKPTPKPKPKAISIDTVSPSPKPTEDADGVLLVSNLSIPLNKMKSKNGAKPALTSTDSNKSKSTGSKSNSPAQTSTIKPVAQSRPSNPYIYVAPDLQRKWSRRRGYGRYNRNNNRSQSQYQLTRRTTGGTPNSAKSGSSASCPAGTPSATGSKDGSPSVSASATAATTDKEGSASASASISISTTAAPVHIPSPNPGFNQHAFLVGKNQIACCQTFKNKVLKEKAEKFGYECKAFVIGLKVLNRTLAIETTADGQEVELQQRFDFSRSVISFLKGLNHLYTDSHIIIELVNCHKIPHFMFPEYEYQRPKKEFIKQHQESNGINHELWKSKSCIATISNDKKEALSATPSPDKKAASASVSNSSHSQTPKFDKDDILMNDDSDIDNIPGLNQAKQGQSGSSGATNFDVMVHDESKENKQPHPSETANGTGSGLPSNPRKRKLDDNDENTEQDMTPPTKKQKIAGNNTDNTDNPEVNQNGNNDVAMNENQGETLTDSDDTTNNIEPEAQPQPQSEPVPTPLPQPHNPGPTEEEKDDMNYSNPYFEKINWEKKFDRSPTFEYALKLYKKSQANAQWMHVCHDLTATATHVYNTCKDQQWKAKLKKILSNEKYGWNGCKYQQPLHKRLMSDLAHDIAFNYINHKNEKKRRRRF